MQLKYAGCNRDVALGGSFAARHQLMTSRSQSWEVVCRGLKGILQGLTKHLCYDNRIFANAVMSLFGGES